MDVAVNNAVGSALAMQEMQYAQQKDAALLKPALNSQASLMVGLLQSLPQLATEGTLGTNVNTYA